jgi:methylated-DNA-[protein]-cysteine S-methyltransferase
MSGAGLALFDTTIGRCGIAWSGRGVVALQLPEAGDEATRTRMLRNRSGIAEATPPPSIRKAIEAIQALMRGEGTDLSFVELDLEGIAEFNRQVYEIARKIPAGETLTYGEIARRLGDVQLSRAVGQALGLNPVAIIVPCHRVLGADRKPGGFSGGGGVQTKLKMLSIERAHIGGTRDLFDLV